MARAPSADACFCGDHGSPTQELAKSAAVFEAHIDKVDPYKSANSPNEQAHVTVLRAWKGTAARSHLVLDAGRGGGGCLYRFETGANYLIYAYKGDDRRLHVSYCSRTKQSAKAQDDFDELGPASK